ncbi:MAG: queuosine precursor transporter [Microbacteriaceae bacterium]
MSSQTSAVPDQPIYASRGRGVYDILIAVFCVVLILSNIGATKGIQFGPIITDGGAFLFPLAYVLGDVLSEVYGFKAARRAIILGFATSILASLSFWLVIIAPAADFYDGQESFERVLGFVPLIVLGSLLGYLVGQLLNSWTLTRIKKITKERLLWVRLIGSTGIGELADTIIFCAIAAGVIGISTWADFLNYVIVGYVYKVGVEIVLLPVTYRVIGWVKKREHYAL